MDLKNTSPFFFFTLLISVTKALDPSCASQFDGSDDLSIIPTYSKCYPLSSPKIDFLVTTVLNMASKDPARVNYLSTLQVLNITNYVVQLKLGTPGQLMNMVLDTSNDIAWAPCSGCTGCSSTTFSPNSSSTYGTNIFFFNQSYGGGSSLSATLVQDALRLGKDVIPKYSFGCINSISGRSIPSQGLLGLGRRSMSLLSQSGSFYSGVFSYCLPSFKSYYFSGSLKLGPPGQPKSIWTTPLLRNPRRRSLYYVNLTEISVGRVLVPISPELLAFNPNTGAGTIIDLGIGTFSSLGAFDTCFSATNEVVAPTITLTFTGLKLTPPSENSLIHRSSGLLACLAMAAAPNNVNSVLNVIANLQQHNLRILFDVANSVVGIARESCN
ncbi:unnamed protein product [Malus baccata var. baccata]